MNIQERLFFDFIIDSTGKVKDIKCIKGNNDILIKAATETLSRMPSFKPAMFDGVPVNYRMRVPITFKFENNSTIVDEELNEINKNWKKGKVLKDPYTRQKIDFNLIGGTKYFKVYYYKSNKIHKEILNEDELERLNELKFDTKKNCKKYYKWL